MLRAIVASKQNHIPSLVPSVRAAFVEALGHGNFEDDESFFDAGGQSLTAATLVGLIFRDVNVGIVPKPADDADDNDDVRLLFGEIAQKKSKSKLTPIV